MNYLKNILPMLLAVYLSGCNKDLLNTIPNDRVSSEIYWETDDDAIYAANGVYTFLPGSETVLNWDGMSDIGHITLMWREESLIERGAYDASLGRIYNEWNFTYKGIQAANAFMANIDRVQTSDPALIDRLKGEVRVLRAYFYTRLAALYGDVPLVTAPLSIEESASLIRTPVDQVWDFIGNEFTEAAPLLPLEQEEKGRITRGAALALKARAMLYAGRFREAADAAKAVMDLDVYSLYPSFEKLFSYEAENNSEVIFDNQYIEDVRGNSAFGYLAPFSQQARGEVVPLKKAVDAYQMKNGRDIDDPQSGFDPRNPYRNRDPRLKYSVYVTGNQLPNGSVYNPVPGSGTADELGYAENSTPTGFNIRKYVNSQDAADPWDCGINIILMRYAEVLLIYAEAMIELGQIDQSVVAAINQVRARPDVDMPPVALAGQEEMRRTVRMERLRELAFEGLRYFDIRRWKTAEEVMQGIVYGMTYEDGNNELQTVSLPSFVRSFNKKRDYLWPVPQREIELNPELGQNPGW